jgi:peptidyl-prolyl cis-trans isomerase C
MPWGVRAVAAAATAWLLMNMAACRFWERKQPAQGEAAGLRAALRIGDTAYDAPELERFFKSRMAEFPMQGQTDEIRSALLESFIEQKLLLAEAAERGVKIDERTLQNMLESTADEPGRRLSPDEEARRRRSIEENLKVQRFVNEYVIKELRVSEEECQEYYQEHLADFIRNDVVHVREILVDDLAQAEKIQAALKANRNRNFAELARLYSKAPTAVRGGDLGRFQRGELPGNLEKAIFRLAPGTTSRTITTEFGYHIFLVEERIPAHQQKFFEARREIEEKLLLERQRSAIDKEVAYLANQTPVEIYPGNLGFRYTGTRFPAQKEVNP